MSKKNIIPEGTRDLILEECAIKESIESNVENLFKSYGFKEIVTPTIEFYETFNNDFKSLEEEEMYKFFDNRGRILVLRPDMTIPIARVVETKLKEMKMPIKLRYRSNVFRVHASLRGKQNEFTDCGVELVGAESEKSDLEVIVLALESLKRLKVDNFKLEIGNINLLKSIFSILDISEYEKENIAQFIEDKNLKNLEEYLDKLNLSDKYKILLNKLPWMFGGKEILDEAKNIAFNTEIENVISYFEDLYVQLESLGYSDYVTFDFGMAPGLNYYTGIIFRGYAEGIGDIFLRGGRYDNLIKLKDEYIPAIGFSINTNSAIDVLKNNGYLEDNEKKCTISYGKKNKVLAIRKSIEYRNNGYIVEMLPVDEDIFEIKY